MTRSLEAMEGHIVLCGAGRTGRQVMEELISLGQELVVLERDGERVQWIHEHFPDVLTVGGDATLDGNLTRRRGSSGPGLS